jgi:hypothetical protein
MLASYASRTLELHRTSPKVYGTVSCDTPGGSIVPVLLKRESANWQFHGLFEAQDQAKDVDGESVEASGCCP